MKNNILLWNCKRIVRNHRHSIVELSGTIDTALAVRNLPVYVLFACFQVFLHGNSVMQIGGGKSTINYFYPCNILLFFIPL